jgi:drug/metabolite transporter, DME family
MSVVLSPRASRTGLLLVSAGAVLWGTTGVAVQIVHDRSALSAVSIGWYRLAIAAAFVAAASRGRLVSHGAAAVRRRPLALLACGIGFGAYQALYFVGVQNVGVSISTLVSLGVAPVALTLGTACARRRLPSPSSVGVLALAVVGLALVSLRAGSAAGGAHPALGVLASVASGLGYAGTTALSRRLPDEEPLLLTGVTSVIGAVALLPLALAAGLHLPGDPIATAWLGYIGIVPTSLAYWLFYRGLRTTEPEVAGVVTLLEPLAAAALAAVVLHETLSVPAVVGACLMLVAVGSFYVGPSRAGATELPEVPPPP